MNPPGPNSAESYDYANQPVFKNTGDNLLIPPKKDGNVLEFLKLINNDNTDESNTTE